ncbi:MAG: chitobiase/beta-hexosaminidase C-terminal domain-containing protein, partial [bacterium]|nr:chitobiase/beta-hexosaminidase C-terminal domain-containing protein [bacterium]
LAVAEIAWTPQELRSWLDFKPRMNAHIPVLQQKGIHAFTLSDEIEATMTVDTLKREIQVIMDAEKYPAEIHYTTDGTMPTTASPLYTQPIVVKDSAHVVAAIFRDGQPQGEPTEKKVDYHRGINKPIQYNSRLYSGYMAGGMNALLDGYRGGLTYLDGRWQGYLDNLDCVIDMGEVTDMHKVSARFMQLIGPGVFQPKEVELLTSEDGENFTSQGIVPTTISNTDRDLSFQEYTFYGAWKARYVRLKAKRGNPGFIFTDEVVIW